MSEGDGGVNDLAGLGELANSEVGNKVYDDGLSGPAKSLGKGLTDIVDGLRLFTVPFQMMATVHERIARWLEQVRADVQPERQVDAAPEIAGPVLEKLRFHTDDNPLTELYLNLLRRAIDKERREEAHPAFPSVISELSADEALLLYRIWNHSKQRISVIAERYPAFRIFRDRNTKHGPYGPNLMAYISHLRALSLFAQPQLKVVHKPGYLAVGESDIQGSKVEATQDAREVQLTAFGAMFCKAVLPEVYPGEPNEESLRSESE